MRVAVAVIAKAPVAHSVKTRLCPPLGPHDAADVAAAMLLDVVDNCAAPDRDVVCVYAGETQALRVCVGQEARILPQGPGGLARRLRRAQATLFAEGYESVVLMSGDSPTVDPALMEEVVGVMQRQEADVVIGPACDGGYTLLATRAAVPALFDRVEMSTERVLEQTLRQADQAGLTTHLVSVRHDIDTVADYRAALARGELQSAPRTRAVLGDALASAHDATVGPGDT